MAEPLPIASVVCPMDDSCREYERLQDMIKIRLRQIAALHRALDLHTTGEDDDLDTLVKHDR
jgi:hypothetical protein